MLDGNGFERFGFDPDSGLPTGPSGIANKMDSRFRNKVHPALRGGVEAYQQTREATRAYGEIFRSPMLRVNANSQEPVDGISNQELVTMLGAEGAGRSRALALRLFHFGCPAVFLNQGFYDFHSNEDDGLSDEMDQANRLISGLRTALQQHDAPQGRLLLGQDAGGARQRVRPHHATATSSTPPTAAITPVTWPRGGCPCR